MRTIVTALTLALVAVASVASADTPPPVWSRARDPGAKDRWALHLEVRKLLDESRTSIGVSPAFPSFAEFQVAHARDLLERANVMEGEDPVLLFDLGMACERLERHERAVVAFRRGLSLAPNHPAAPEALLTLAVALAKLDRPDDERGTYLAFLEQSTDPDARGVALYNFAEAEMRLGRLPEAIRGYREAMGQGRSMARTGTTYVLALWGLAVALDRYGDTSAAEREADRAAVQLDPWDHVIDNHDTVFFVPAYERHWYLGLGAAARARAAGNDARAALRYAQKAESHWTEYVLRATPKDRWKALAERHLTAAKRERQRLEAKVRALPPVRASDEDVN